MVPKLSTIVLNIRPPRSSRSSTVNVHFISGLIESKADFVAVDFPQANRLTIHILAAVSEHEAHAIGTRTKDALRAARARGVKLGTRNPQMIAQRTHRAPGPAPSCARQGRQARSRHPACDRRHPLDRHHAPGDRGNTEPPRHPCAPRREVVPRPGVEGPGGGLSGLHHHRVDRILFVALTADEHRRRLRP